MTNADRNSRHIAARRMALYLLPLALVALTGCPPPGKTPIRLPPPPLRSLAENVAAVNNNVASITESLGASGDISARINDEGKRKSYELDGTLRFLPPRHFYLNLSHLGMADAMRIGSNDEIFWVWVKPEVEKLWWGRWADLDPAKTYKMPLPPDMILSAMGLSPLPSRDSGLDGPQPRTRGDRYYELLYYARGENGPWIQREYWLDRYPPFLPRVVIFREPGGQVQMQANLDRYERVARSQTYVARDIGMHWPQTGDSLRIRLKTLKFYPDITAASAAYQLPKRVPIARDRWVRVTSEGEVDESAATHPPATTPAVPTDAPASPGASDAVPGGTAVATAPAVP